MASLCTDNGATLPNCVIQHGSRPANQTHVYPIRLRPPTERTDGVFGRIHAGVVSFNHGIGMFNLVVGPICQCAVMKLNALASQMQSWYICACSSETKSLGQPASTNQLSDTSKEFAVLHCWFTYPGNACFVSIASAVSSPLTTTPLALLMLAIRVHTLSSNLTTWSTI